MITRCWNINEWKSDNPQASSRRACFSVAVRGVVKCLVGGRTRIVRGLIKSSFLEYAGVKKLDMVSFEKIVATHINSKQQRLVCSIGIGKGWIWKDDTFDIWSDEKSSVVNMKRLCNLGIFKLDATGSKYVCLVDKEA